MFAISKRLTRCECVHHAFRMDQFWISTPPASPTMQPRCIPPVMNHPWATFPAPHGQEGEDDYTVISPPPVLQELNELESLVDRPVLASAVYSRSNKPDMLIRFSYEQQHRSGYVKCYSTIEGPTDLMQQMRRETRWHGSWLTSRRRRGQEWQTILIVQFQCHPMKNQTHETQFVWHRDLHFWHCEQPCIKLRQITSGDFWAMFQRPMLTAINAPKMVCPEGLPEGA